MVLDLGEDKNVNNALLHGKHPTVTIARSQRIKMLLYDESTYKKSAFSTPQS